MSLALLFDEAGNLIRSKRQYMNETKYFFDIHFHAFNLSHPNLGAFVKRFIKDKSLLFIISISIALGACFVIKVYLNVIAYILFFLIFIILLLFFLFPYKFSGLFLKCFEKLLKRPLNTLTLMENDMGNYFLLIEDELKSSGFLVKDIIKGKSVTYDRIVLTPLMMDFGNKKIMSRNLVYGERPVSKPIAEQVTDVFNGIRTYRAHRPSGIFEIYPFLGINTQNYKLREIPELLDKYFKSYRGRQTDLYGNMGKFNGNIDDLESNFFAGIKVYPPLGFDPWPKGVHERLKVEFLYRHCEEKRIPITTHCSDGGFIIDSFGAANKRSSPEKWERVLEKYPELKLNLAHMGACKGILSRMESQWTGKSWTDMVFCLISTYTNVYADFSCQGFDDEYYRALKEQMERKSHELSEILKLKNIRLKDKILFGSDLMINLLWTDSYSRYMDVFFRTSHFSEDEKNSFCSCNPEKFLFG